MSIWLSVILCALLGYLLGCINPAYLIARARGFDIRSRGSGNAGASNAVITMGKAAGVFSPQSLTFSRHGSLSVLQPAILPRCRSATYRSPERLPALPVYWDICSRFSWLSAAEKALPAWQA